MLRNGTCGSVLFRAPSATKHWYWWRERWRREQKKRRFFTFKMSNMFQNTPKKRLIFFDISVRIRAEVLKAQKCKREQLFGFCRMRNTRTVGVWTESRSRTFFGIGLESETTYQQESNHRTLWRFWVRNQYCTSGALPPEIPEKWS